MIALTINDVAELLVGFVLIWVGIYLISRDPYSKLSWVIFGCLFAWGLTIFTDTILLQARNVAEYTHWQKILDAPLFFAMILYFHVSQLVKQNKSKLDKYILVIGYLGALALYLMDVHGGLILNESVLRLPNFRRFDGFAPGKMFIPFVVFLSVYAIVGATNFFANTKSRFWYNFLPGLGGIIYSLTGILGAISFYVYLFYANIAFMIGLALGTLLFAFPIIRYHLFLEKKIFDRLFVYRTLVFIVLILIYFLSFKIVPTPFQFPQYVQLIFITLMIMLTHSFYDWFSTFINDLLFNIASGFSVVTDAEVANIVKNLNKLDMLEDSPLLRLGMIYNKNGRTPVDSLRSLLEESIEYFKPKEDSNRRTKRNLKYHLLKMVAFDEAEEGQILWELGFDEYPVRILTKETKDRPPLFKAKSPSDYTYTSRNAYLALKREAIHDVAWRISYLEKLSKKKLI